MRIGIVLYPTFGGSGVVATELGKALARNGHEVHFISYSQPVRMDAFQQGVFFHEVMVPDYPLFDFDPYEVALTSALVRTALQEKLDLIHVHYAIPHAPAAFMAREILKTKGRFVPFITTLHGTDITLVGKDKSYEPVISFAINLSDAVTAVSAYLKEETLKHFSITKNIEVIYNFIDPIAIAEEKKECSKATTAPNGEKVIMHISNFRKVKRVQDVVQAFRIIASKIPSKLIMVGDGPERNMAENLAVDLGIREQCMFIGKVKNSLSILPCADVFFLPSASESFGLSALEAMACGIPVIGSNAGGLPEVQIHGKTGFLSEVGDYQDMAKNTLKILSSPSQYQEFSKHCIEQADLFRLDLILPQYENLYNRVFKEFTSF
ncbi:MAG: N-acetyl-alpha-D-glucosaminyl L-malate synthase BshA [Bacteroidetes bacterium]|nr:N-acetyl-alpha-D-glucosaminyl L-malate synthase BshA [Bacteroidota bacterium]